MSTYLVCFIVSDFVDKSMNVSGTLQGADDFEMRVFSNKSNIAQMEYALNVGVKMLEQYIQYFNIPFPLPKLGEFKFWIRFFIL